jgi:hypothetical protein
MVRIKIIDAFGIGYVAGKEYNVDPAEAKKLVDAGQAVALEATAPPKKENAVNLGPAKAEKAVVK